MRQRGSLIFHKPSYLALHNQLPSCVVFTMHQVWSPVEQCQTLAVLQCFFRVSDRRRWSKRPLVMQLQLR